jgi:hypothetical protein
VLYSEEKKNLTSVQFASDVVWLHCIVVSSPECTGCNCVILLARSTNIFESVLSTRNRPILAKNSNICIGPMSSLKPMCKTDVKADVHTYIT